MQPTVQEQLDAILDQVLKDEGLDKELQSNLADLITAASSDPTPENLEAVAIVFSKLSDANKYMEAMTNLQNIDLKKDYEKMTAESEASQSPQVPETPTDAPVPPMQ